MSSADVKAVWLYTVTTARNANLEIHGPAKHHFCEALLEHVEKVVSYFDRPCTVFIFGAPVDPNELALLAEADAAIYSHRWCLAMARKDTVHGGLAVTMSTVKFACWFREES